MEIVYREEKDRWIKGDKFIRPVIRRVIRRKKTRRSGMQQVVYNFRKGLDRKGIKYGFNSFPQLIKPSTKVISFGLGSAGVLGLNRNTPVIAAIGFQYPVEFPDLCEKYNIQKFLQHSQWILDYVKSANLYDENVFDLWFAGIDTDEWKPNKTMKDRSIDVLLYDKVHWNREAREKDLIQPMRSFLASQKITFDEIRYGQYTPIKYKEKLDQCKMMIFISEHETQGIAYQECMAKNVPVMAWNPGFVIDPEMNKYSQLPTPSTSVPFFDERCGLTFRDNFEFKEKFSFFFERACAGKYFPREFVLENLSIDKSTERMLEIYNSV